MNLPIKEGSQKIGTVVAVQANFYQVRLDGSDQESFLLCTRRTRLKKIGQKVMVGDRVLVEQPNDNDERGAITEVFPRRSELKRPAIANVDQILLLFALEEPTLEPWQLSRSLVMAESTGLELCLCLNKTDLITSQQQQQWRDRLNQWGYQPIFISVTTLEGLDELLNHLKNKITIITGLSGTGKSSLINELVPDLNIRVGKVSGKLRHGAHTTRHVELFYLPRVGFIADSPGFNQLELGCQKSDLALFFPEVQKLLSQSTCQFSDCSHRDEPNCLVKGDWERYQHYLKFLAEAITNEESLMKNKEESSLKLKSKGEGKQNLEPKLDAKKYRRSSRRERTQSLQEMINDEL